MKTGKAPVLIREIANRDFIKRMMQPWVYGSTAYQQVRAPENSELKDFLDTLGKKHRLRLQPAGRGTIAAAFDAVVKRRLRETLNLQKWLKTVAVELWKKGHRHAQWRTPSGWEVWHQPMEPAEKRVLEFSTPFTPRRSMTLITGWAPDKGAFCKALAPNVIHSLDAAHLALTVREARARGVRSFAAVHDCVGTHAGKVEVLRNCLRIVFASEEFAGAAQKMLDDFAELSGKRRPPRGDLDLSGVLRSDYFFD